MKNKDILISVIIPVYNAEQHLERCLQSVLKQTYSNLEIILVDDGSTDRSGEICDEFGRRDNRIIVVHKKNGGQAQARNKGLDIAKGDYIGFVDNDDVVDSRMYELLLLNALKENVEISGCSTMMVYQNGDKVNSFEKIESGIKNGRDLILNVLYQNQLSWGTVWNKIFNIRLKDDLYFPEGKEFEDYWVMLRLFDKVKKIYFEQQPMYEWYQYDFSQSKRGFHENSLTCVEIIDSLRQYFSNTPFKDMEIMQALDYFEFITRYWLLNSMWKSEKMDVSSEISMQLKFIKGLIPKILKKRKCNMKICKCIIKIYILQFLILIQQ